MKKIVIAFALLFFLLPLSAEIYKYKDDKGRVCFVDSIYQVPPEFRKKMEVLPSGKDVNWEEKVFTNYFLKHNAEKRIGDYYFSFVFLKIKAWVIFLSLFFVFGMLISFFKKDISLFLIFLLLTFLISEGVYFFKIYPEVSKATKIYSYLTSSYGRYELKAEDRIKKKILEKMVFDRPVPLNPFSYFKRVERLKEFYNLSFKQKKSEEK